MREGLEWLLESYPYFDLVEIDWQVEPGPPYRLHAGPWVLVALGQPSESFEQTPAWAIHHFAIWKVTGAVHRMNGGEVIDPELWRPG